MKAYTENEYFKIWNSLDKIIDCIILNEIPENELTHYIHKKDIFNYTNLVL